MLSDAELVLRIIAAKALVATAESCTGGLIAHRITEIAGSSAAFWGSWVTYDNQAKIELGVTEETLQIHGAVSQEVAREMALSAWKKVKQAAGTTPRKIYALSTTGVAGPGGGSDKKPVGLCCVGIAWSPHHVKTFEIRASSELGRSAIKNYFADHALLALGEAL